MPLDINIAASSDEGTPFVLLHPDSVASHCVISIAVKLEELLEKPNNLNAKRD
jgi:MinD-like ATPase involved in chromosome partitioning or flagellar assembly